VTSCCRRARTRHPSRPPLHSHRTPIPRVLATALPARGAKARIASHRGSPKVGRVVVPNRHRRVGAAVSVRRGRLGVPAAAGGAYERGIGTTIRNHSEDAVSAREASAGYPPDAERGGRGEAEQARRARRRAKAKGRRAVRCISNRSNEAAGVYGLEPAPHADGCLAHEADTAASSGRSLLSASSHRGRSRVSRTSRNTTAACRPGSARSRAPTLPRSKEC